MSSIDSFRSSTNSLIHETGKISGYIDDRFWHLVLYPSNHDADIDFNTYCSHYASIKRYIFQLPDIGEFKMLKSKSHDLPTLNHDDFEYNTWGIPVFLLYVLLPVGVLVGFNTYIKLSALQDKLKLVEGTLNTIYFFAKAIKNDTPTEVQV
ncbi:hypothetical protein [Aridibaculum aurantiacum]|uniref:hypothetical protein n=1 Tax=Aridibaculum aurantiacum TaxID=2810307 RepID=UPI001A956B51|nr:hypothetical protein [Aridibaculum aurantiacum]